MQPSMEQIAADVSQVLAEDVGSGDLTAALIPEEARAEARVVCRESAILCGKAWFDEVFRQLDEAIRIEWLAAEGDRLSEGQTVCRLAGSARHLLTGERSALNFLQTLSGVATVSACYADAVKGTGTKVLDTRKTLPGLRLAQKYAVTCGGAFNHRVGLYDAILIKENHIMAAGSIEAAVKQALQVGQGVEVEVEVESLQELQQALAAGAKRVLLDNFSLDQLREAVALGAGRARLEASGGVTLETIRGIAETGVDDISVGVLTKDLKATDYSMRFEIG